MRYILKEIESEEEFVEVFGRNPGWILSPTKLNKSIDGDKAAPSNPKHSHERKIKTGFRKLFFWRRKC